MYAEPPIFDRSALAAVLRAQWGILAGELEYLPVGFGTHHYRAGEDWFVNVDVLAAKTWPLEPPLTAARRLAAAGLEFVHAPVPSLDGRVTAPMPGGYAVSVYPFLSGTSNPYGEFRSEELRREVLAAVRRMHALPISMGDLRRDTLEIPRRQEFLACLRSPESPWTGGPYAERARLLVLSHETAIRARFDRYDELVQAVLGNASSWVVTHGEPHAGNVMRLSDGSIRLIDWDTAAIGPPERDLWMIAPRTPEEEAACDPAAMALYKLGWALSEVAGYTLDFHGPHADDANTQTAWRGLSSYVDELVVPGAP